MEERAGPGAPGGLGYGAAGEVGIVVAQLGVAVGVLNADLYAVVMFMTVATTMIAPPAIVRVFRPLVGSPQRSEKVLLSSRTTSQRN